MVRHNGRSDGGRTAPCARDDTRARRHNEHRLQWRGAASRRRWHCPPAAPCDGLPAPRHPAQACSSCHSATSGHRSSTRARDRCSHRRPGRCRQRRGGKCHRGFVQHPRGPALRPPFSMLCTAEVSRSRSAAIAGTCRRNEHPGDPSSSPPSVKGCSERRVRRLSERRRGSLVSRNRGRSA